ncbi:MAG: EAL domain-containing protein [Desulfovibrio sp.]|nr:EAL domain-containing protein [Desulfovibrio sp.]MBI4957987.1 EAL domain-containing protein [Desulfovibrio sp.]
MDLTKYTPATDIVHDGRTFPLRPLYELENGTLAAVELAFENSFSSETQKLAAIKKVLHNRRGILHPGAFLCVSLGGEELADPKFPSDISGICDKIGISPANLGLFFPDDSCLKLGLRALDQFLTLKRFGFRLGLDIVSLESLPALFVERLPADVLRLDPLDSLALDEDPQSQRDILDFVAFAANLLMTPAARGVSSHMQLSKLKSMGIRIGQGPLFSGQTAHTPS